MPSRKKPDPPHGRRRGRPPGPAPGRVPASGDGDGRRSAGSELLQMMGLVAIVVVVVILLFFALGYIFGRMFL